MGAQESNGNGHGLNGNGAHGAPQITEPSPKILRYLESMLARRGGDEAPREAARIEFAFEYWRIYTSAKDDYNRSRIGGVAGDSEHAKLAMKALDNLRELAALDDPKPNAPQKLDLESCGRAITGIIAPVVVKVLVGMNAPESAYGKIADQINRAISAAIEGGALDVPLLSE